MKILAPTSRSSSSSSFSPTSAQFLLALLLSLSVASQPGDQSDPKRILKRLLVKKSKSTGSSSFPPKGPFERSQMLEPRDHHPNSIPDSYAAPTAAASPPSPTNFSSGYLPPSMTPLVEEEAAMAAMLGRDSIDKLENCTKIAMKNLTKRPIRGGMMDKAQS